MTNQNRMAVRRSAELLKKIGAALSVVESAEAVVALPLSAWAAREKAGYINEGQNSKRKSAANIAKCRDEIAQVIDQLDAAVAVAKAYVEGGLEDGPSVGLV